MRGGLAFLVALSGVIGSVAWGTERIWPDVDRWEESGQRAPQDAAVVVGNESYPLMGIDVPFASRDADAFARFLVRGRGVPSEQIHPLIGADPHEVREAVQLAASQVGEDGVFWFYFAGHGVAHPNTGRRMLLGDTAKGVDRLDDHAVGVDQITAWIGGGQAILVIDACYTGISRTGVPLTDDRSLVPDFALPEHRDQVEWTAASKGQQARPLHETRHGAFTYFVLGALRGWADGFEQKRRDNKVTLGEAHAYVRQALVDVGVRGQTPMLLAEGMERVVLHQGRRLEPAPSLAELLVSQDGDATSEFLEQMRDQSVRERQEAKLRSRIDAASEDLRTRAAKDWAVVTEDLSANSPAAIEGLTYFLQYYTGKTVVVDGVEHVVVLPQVEQGVDLLQRVQGGERVHLGRDLAGEDLSGKDLSGRDLTRADLHEAVLVGTDLGGADLSHANLKYAVLRGANLRDAVLTEARMQGADLRGANLVGATLEGAHMSSARLDGTLFDGHMEWPESVSGPNGLPAGTLVVGPKAQLSGAQLAGMDLSRLALMGADLSEADLTGADLSRARMAGSGLRRAVLVSASLRRTDLRGARLTGANLEGADLTRANLCAADLGGAQLSQARLAGALVDSRTRFSGSAPHGVVVLGPHTDLRAADLTDHTLSGVSLQGSNLKGVSLSGASLEGLDLFGANLEGAQLEGADLIGTDLRGANLENADLRYADLSSARLQDADLTGAVLTGATLLGAVYSGSTIWPSGYAPQSVRGLTLVE